MVYEITGTFLVLSFGMIATAGILVGLAIGGFIFRWK